MPSRTLESELVTPSNRGTRQQRFILIASIAAILLAMGLRTIHYSAMPSMWFDELAIARNVADHSLTELILDPLDHRQVAPVGFLIAVKTSTMLLGSSELAFRLVPWGCAMVAPILFWLITRRFVGGLPLIAGLLIFAVSPALTWYGGNLKQYSGDITISLVLVWFALRYRDEPARLSIAITIGAVGGLLLPCSQPAIVTAFFLGLVLLVDWWGRRSERPFLPLAALGCGWGLGAIVAATMALRLVDAETMSHMKDFWADGFPPSPSAPLEFLLWYPRQIIETFGVFLFHIGARIPPLAQIVIVLAVAAIAGLLHATRRDRWMTLLLVVPLLGALLAATGHLLPFRDRVGIHATWPLLILAMIGFDALRLWLPTRIRGLVPAALVVLAGLPVAIVLTIGRPPYRGHQEMRPLLTEFATVREAKDAIYVFHGARHAMHFYGPDLGINKSEWTEGGIHYGDTRAYLHEIDAFRGNSRVWFIYTQMLPRYEAPKAVLAYLDEIGVQLEVIADPYGQSGQSEAAAYLYHISDPVRLERTTADTFLLPVPASQ